MAISCTYEYDADIPSDTSIIVIDGQILAGGTSSVSVSKATRLDGADESAPLYATGILRGEDGSEIQGTTQANGWFEGTSPFSSYYPGDFKGGYSTGVSISFPSEYLQKGQKYKLFIDAGENGSFESDWLTINKAPVLDKLGYIEHEGVMSGSYYSGRYVDFTVSAHSDSSPYFMVSFEEAWEYTALENSSLEYNPETNQIVEAYSWPLEHPYYRCWRSSGMLTLAISAAGHTEKTINDAIVTSISAYNEKISVLYRLTVNVGCATKEYQEFWDNLQQISYADGDLFTPIPSNMEGNIHRTSGSGVVLGFVSASEVASDHMYYTGNGFHRTSPERNTLRREFTYFTPNYDHPDDYFQYYHPDASEWHRAYMNGNVPWRNAIDANGEEIPGLYLWANKNCLDCRFFGGDITFPSDWPDRNDPNL